MEIQIIEILLCIRMYTTYYIVWVSHLLWVDFQTVVPIPVVQSTGFMMTQMQQPVNKKENHIVNTWIGAFAGLRVMIYHKQLSDPFQYIVHNNPIWSLIIY